jgi:hypothetical protein
MGFLDDLVNKAFRTDQDGRRIYYSGLGKEYIISSEAEFQRIRKNHKIFLLISFIWLIGSLPLIPVIGKQGDLRSAILIIPYFMPLEIWLYWQRRHLKRADEGLTFHEKIAKRAENVPINLLMIYGIACVGFVIAGVFIILTDWRHWLYSLASMITIGFFGYRAIIVAKILIAKG